MKQLRAQKKNYRLRTHKQSRKKLIKTNWPKPLLKTRNSLKSIETNQKKLWSSYCMKCPRKLLAFQKRLPFFLFLIRHQPPCRFRLSKRKMLFLKNSNNKFLNYLCKSEVSKINSPKLKRGMSQGNKSSSRQSKMKRTK